MATKKTSDNNNNNDFNSMNFREMINSMQEAAHTIKNSMEDFNSTVQSFKDSVDGFKRQTKESSPKKSKLQSDLTSVSMNKKQITQAESMLNTFKSMSREVKTLQKDYHKLHLNSLESAKKTQEAYNKKYQHEEDNLKEYINSLSKTFKKDMKDKNVSIIGSLSKAIKEIQDKADKYSIQIGTLQDKLAKEEAKRIEAESKKKITVEKKANDEWNRSITEMMTGLSETLKRSKELYNITGWQKASMPGLGKWRGHLNNQDLYKHMKGLDYSFLGSLPSSASGDIKTKKGLIQFLSDKDGKDRIKQLQEEKAREREEREKKREAQRLEKFQLKLAKYIVNAIAKLPIVQKAGKALTDYAKLRALMWASNKPKWVQNATTAFVGMGGMESAGQIAGKGANIMATAAILKMFNKGSWVSNISKAFLYDFAPMLALLEGGGLLKKGGGGGVLGKILGKSSGSTVASTVSGSTTGMINTTPKIISGSVSGAINTNKLAAGGIISNDLLKSAKKGSINIISKDITFGDKSGNWVKALVGYIKDPKTLKTLFSVKNLKNFKNPAMLLGLMLGVPLIDNTLGKSENRWVRGLGGALSGGLSGAASGSLWGAGIGGILGGIGGAIFGGGVGAVPGAIAGAGIGAKIGAVGGGIWGVVTGFLKGIKEDTGKMSDTINNELYYRYNSSYTGKSSYGENIPTANNTDGNPNYMSPSVVASTYPVTKINTLSYTKPNAELLVSKSNYYEKTKNTKYWNVDLNSHTTDIPYSVAGFGSNLENVFANNDYLSKERGLRITSGMSTKGAMVNGKFVSTPHSKTGMHPKGLAYDIAGKSDAELKRIEQEINKSGLFKAQLEEAGTSEAHVHVAATDQLVQLLEKESAERAKIYALVSQIVSSGVMPANLKEKDPTGEATRMLIGLGLYNNNNGK